MTIDDRLPYPGFHDNLVVDQHLRLLSYGGLGEVLEFCGAVRREVNIQTNIMMDGGRASIISAGRNRLIPGVARSMARCSIG